MSLTPNRVQSITRQLTTLDTSNDQSTTGHTKSTRIIMRAQSQAATSLTQNHRYKIFEPLWTNDCVHGADDSYPRGEFLSQLKEVMDGFLKEDKKTMWVYTNSQSTISIAKNLVYHGRSKHILTKWYFIGERVAMRWIALKTGFNKCLNVLVRMSSKWTLNWLVCLVGRIRHYQAWEGVLEFQH